jgi:hypothetical protein
MRRPQRKAAPRKGNIRRPAREISMRCNRCDGTGFLNADQIPEDVLAGGVEQVQKWMAGQDCPGPDVQICDCCGDGEFVWYGEPGEHYTQADPVGKHGPYAYNGGLCECN